MAREAPLEGWRAVGSLEADRAIIDIAGRLITRNYPIRMGAIAAGKKLSVGEALPLSASIVAGTTRKDITSIVVSEVGALLVTSGYLAFTSMGAGRRSNASTAFSGATSQLCG